MARSVRATRAVPEGDLPAVTRVRTRVLEGPTDDHAVVLAFENGAEIRYRETAEAIHEAWVPPDDDDPAVVHEREGESAEALALGTVGGYLSFDGRTRATFVWGEENVGVLLGE
jgi:hypothetical protein